MTTHRKLEHSTLEVWEDRELVPGRGISDIYQPVRIPTAPPCQIPTKTASESRQVRGGRLERGKKSKIQIQMGRWCSKTEVAWTHWEQQGQRWPLPGMGLA